MLKEKCVHSDLCGGCLYQGIEYDEQKKIKYDQVLALLEDKGIEPEELLGFEGCPSIYGYRNKMEYTFGNAVKDGPMTLGMHQRGRFMNVITTDQCQLVPDDFNVILRAVLDYFTERGSDFYLKRTHTGFLRNLIIRRGVNTGELLVNLVTTSSRELDVEGFTSMLLSLPTKDTIVGILQTINDNVADAVNCDELRTLYGRDYYNEKIMGLDFRVSAFSFFQTNIEAVERLYREAIEMAGDASGMTVFDLYCGTGTISQAVAGSAKRVIGVEIVEEAVEAARENASSNGLSNVSFIAGDVLAVIDSIEEKPDMIILDPPRMGIHHRALPKLTAYGVNNILYISCNPKTMVDNLKFMEYNGYKVEKFKAYDNFGFTKHCESVALLRKNSI